LTDNITTNTRAQKLLAALAFIIAIAILLNNLGFYHDDSFITLRYARNFLAGEGIVWNSGEYVQGYSNFLMLAAVSALGVMEIDLVVASQIIGVVSLLALIVLLVRFGRNPLLAVNPQLRLMPAIIVGTSAPLLVWSIGGLETLLFTLMVSIGCLTILSQDNADSAKTSLVVGGAALGLSFLTRPDGIIFIAVTTLYIAYLHRNAHPIKALALFATAVAITTLPYITWQFLYYGDVVPNTFYAKAAGFSLQRFSGGWVYLSKYLLLPPFLPLVSIATAFAVMTRGGWNHRLSYLLFTVFVYMLYIAAVGGDHMQAFRFIVPIIPLTAFLLTLCLSKLDIFTTGRRAQSVLLSVLVLSVLQFASPSLNPKHFDEAALVGKIVGQYIDKTWPKDSLIALNTAGSTPYFAAEYRYIDMLGLNDSHIAKRVITETQLPWQDVPGHRKGDGAYVLSREPDYILIGPALGVSIDDPWFLSDLEIANDPHFLNDYEFHWVKPVPDIWPDFKFSYYQRRSKIR